MKHYHAFAGLHGYLPNYSGTYETYDAAVDDLASLHELGRKRETILRREGYIELDLARDGNEYAEVSECEEEGCEKG